MIKRFFDIALSFLGLLFLSPILGLFSLLVYSYDRSNPFYIAERVGKNGITFNMVKLRSMVMNADKSGLASTSNVDNRITPVGKYIRKYKLDEFTQLWNVFKGDMSLVGPRPNVKSDVKLYSSEESKLLSISPGITDIASIVFSDEGEILEGHDDVDLAYQQLIRPGKGLLGLYYVTNRSIYFDLQLIFATLLAIISKDKAISFLIRALKNKNAPKNIIDTVSREEPLSPKPPIGHDDIFISR